MLQIIEVSFLENVSKTVEKVLRILYEREESL